ncbi:MFS transporter [Clostridium uliginosum]|uniref:Na+/melibiose symporter n=1 Tax=Clostridium uliginosum TaxID=119641 RepID=A0A1I1Q431_9CLOT|nr:MFS transporter [Clostridium uliginosum]SFD16757.1 Na+/melibiose symporter [Clostridium uliginosum]
MKKSKNLWMYIGGRFISLIGSGIQMIALPLYILDLTGSGILMGVFSILTLVPALITAPFSGIIGDRRNRRNIMIAMDFGRGALILFFGIIAMTGFLNIYILFSLQVFISIMDSLFNSSSAALMPELISKDELIEANSAKGGFDAASMILGPALGGVIYGVWGIQMVFYMNSVSFIISAVFSMFITYNKKVVEKEKINIKMFLNENSEVLKFIVNKKGLFQLFTFAMISNFLLVPMFDIVMPYALKKEVGFASQQYGYIMGFYTVGILLGNIAISVYFKKLGLKKLMRFGLITETIVTIGACALVFPQIVSIYGGATWTLFISISICCITMGFFNAFVNTPISTNLQNLVPDEMRSRFFSIMGMFSQGAVPVGALLFGILLDTMKYYNLLTIINILAVLVAAIFLTRACDEAYEAKE